MAKLLSEGWRELHRPSQAECPKLFYNLVFVDNELSLQVTDLVAIWNCSLNKQEIIESAGAQHASIDPSQSNSQLQVLVQKLDQGLRSDDNVLYHDKDIESQFIYLKTFVELPQPLKALTWIFKLAPQPATELAEHLLRPCLFEASVSKRKLESLQNVIKEKDHVLSRLFERIEATSTDLSMMFPGITGLKTRRGRVTVREAERHVPGMRKFDIQEWLSHFHTDNPYAGYDQKGINNLVVGCEECPKHAAKEHFSWLEKLPEYGSKPTKGPRSLGKIGALNIRPVPIDDNQSTASEDDFGRQHTPPSLQHRENAKSPDRRFGSSPTTSDEGGKTTEKSNLDHLTRPERSVDRSERPPSQKVGRPSVASQKGSHQRRMSTASTASETQSDIELSVETKRDSSRADESKLSSPSVKEGVRDNSNQQSLQSSSEDDLDLDSQANKKTTHKSSNEASNASQRHTKTRTPPPPIPSTPSRRLLSTAKSTTPQTTPPQPRHPTNPPSDPSTPSKTRRLGRLGTSQSQSHSLSPQTQQSRFFNPQIPSSTNTNTNTNPNRTFSPTNDKNENDDEDENLTSFLSTTTDPDAESNKPRTRTKDKDPTPEPEEKKIETASEAANRRRQELKRKLQPVKQDRKRRKF